MQPDNLPHHFDKINSDCERFSINLFENECISKELLFYTAGLKPANSNDQRITGDLAKSFGCKSPAHTYPLFKMHILSEEVLRRKQVAYISVSRLLQSAGQITTSQVVATGC